MKFLGFFLCFLLLVSSFGVFVVSGDVAWYGQGSMEYFSHRKLVSYGGVAGAGTNYVVYVNVSYADGTDAVYPLSGGYKGVNASLVFVDGECQEDFGDVRFLDDDGVSLLDYWLDSEVDSSYGLFAVEVADDCSSAFSFYVYFGFVGAEGLDSLSDSAETFRRVISSGVVLSLPMNEGTGLAVTDYSGNSNHGTITAGVTAPTWITTGRFANGLSFDGGDKFSITDSGSLDVTTNVTAIFYVAYSTMNRVTLLSKGLATYEFGGEVASDEMKANIVIGGVLKTPITLIANLVVGQEYSLGYVFPTIGGNFGFYKDGVVSREQAYAGSIATDNTNILVGQSISNAGFYTGTMSGTFLFNTTLLTELPDLAAYYPQCSSANLGSLYLRSFVSPEPQPVTFGTLETWVGATASPMVGFGGVGELPLIVGTLLICTSFLFMCGLVLVGRKRSY